MNRAASSSIGDVELVIFMVEGTNWTPDDEMVLNKVRSLRCPVLLAINKVDNVEDKTKLLPHIAFLSQQMDFLDVVPLSAEEENERRYHCEHCASAYSAGAVPLPGRLHH